MKILILTAWYHPFIHPRAHRWTVLAEHWANEGHEISVLTARVGDAEKYAVRQGVKVYRIGFDSLKEWVYAFFKMKQGRGRVGVRPGQNRQWLGVLEWLYKATWKQLFFPDDACVWYFPAKRKLFQLLDSEHFDAIFSVSLPFTDHLLGLAAKKRCPELYWLADIGDPFSIQAMPPNNGWLYGRKNLRLERRVLATADGVSVTTGAMITKYRALFGTDAARNITVIPPLFGKLAESSGRGDKGLRAVLTRLTAKSRQTRFLRLGYFGALYGKTRTPDAFLDLLAGTFQHRPDLKGRLSVHFFGEIFPEFYEQLSGQPAIQLHGLCSREESWAAMRQMDVLVNIGNTTDFQLPSKAVDYLATGLPVLNISYVENDPFAQFFQGNPVILNLLIKNGTILESDLLRWIAWLEGEKRVVPEAELNQKLKPFLVESIGAQYLALVHSKAP